MMQASGGWTGGLWKGEKRRGGREANREAMLTLLEP